MKFLLFCDLLRAPAANGRPPIVGVRIVSAAVVPLGHEQESDVRQQLKDLFKDLDGKNVPKPDDAAFDTYLANVAKSAPPLFPWVDGTVDFKFAWAEAALKVPGQPDKGLHAPTALADPSPAKIVAAPPIGLPNNYAMDTGSRRRLLHAALCNLTSESPKHTNRFASYEPFLLKGWNDGTNSREEIVEVNDGASDFRYEAFIASLGSLPGPIPHGALNLCRFFELPTVAAAAADGLPLIIAAPVITPTNLPALVPDFGLGTPADAWRPLGNDGFVGVVKYGSQFKGYPVEVRCKALVDPKTIPASTHSFVDRRTLWVAKTHLLPNPGETVRPDAGVHYDDWLTTLTALAADAFDLTRPLIELVQREKNDTNPPLAIALGAATDRLAAATLITSAVLIALRNVVGPGCIGLNPAGEVKGPNGSPAAQTVLGMLQAIGVEAPQARPRPPPPPPALPTDPTVEERWRELQDSVTAKDREFRNNFRSANTPPPGALNSWLSVLAEALEPDARPAISGPEFLDKLVRQVAISETARGAFDAGPLRRVVDAAVLSANAARIQTAIWKVAGQAIPGIDQWLVKAHEGLAELAARDFRLVETLRRANIDLPWTETQGIWKTGAPDQQDTLSLRENIKAALRAYFTGTLCAASGQVDGLELIYQTKHGRIGQLPNAVRAIVTSAKLIERATDGIEKLLVDKEMDDLGYTKAGLSAEAHPVSLQIDRLIVGTGTDFNEELAGYGVLMRSKAPQGPWCCLTSNYAEINPEEAYGVASDKIKFSTAVRPVLGTLPISYLGEMPQAVVTYNNRPVVGDDIADQVTESQQPDPRLLRLVQPKRGDTPPPPVETLLPFLAYGAIYEAAPFAVSNHGAIPMELRSGVDGHPAIVDPAKLVPTLGNILPADVIRTFPYLRRTGVGSLQVKVEFDPSENGVAQQQGRLFHPMLAPREMRFVAHEVVDKSIKTALLLSAPSEEGGRGLPLEIDNVDFGLLKLNIGAPLTSLEDFDRWLAFDELIETDPTKRQKIAKDRRDLRDTQAKLISELIDLHKQLREAQEQGQSTIDLERKIKEATVKLALQDPAVGGLHIHVKRVRRDGKKDSREESKLFPWTSDKGDSRALPRPVITLECKMMASPPSPYMHSPQDNKGTVLVGDGDVVVVTLCAAVRKKLFTDPLMSAGDADRKRSFDYAVYEAKTGTFDTGGVSYCLFALHSFAVEGASPGIADLAAPNVIGAKIVGEEHRPLADEESNDIRVEFTRTPSALMDAVGEVMIGSQAWRWTGRPLSPFPFHCGSSPMLDDLDAVASPAAADHPLLWDIEGFAERLHETLDDTPSAVPITEDATTGNPIAIRLARYSPKRKEIARYMRFRVTAHNRYAAAYRLARLPLKPSQARWTHGKWATDWFRVFRPAQEPTIVPKPGIRALIPLTRAPGRGADQNLDPISGVLAIVDGAWFEHSGLSDWISAGVEVAYRTKPSPRAAAEFGPDPLLRTYGFGKNIGTTPTESDLRQAVPLEVVGPLGHTFDTGTATGLYLNSSFVVRAPRLTGPAAAQIPGAWWMGKLNFRRMVLAEGVKGYTQSRNAAGQNVESNEQKPQACITLHKISNLAAAEQTIILRGTLQNDTPSLPITLKKNAEFWDVTVLDTHTINASTFDLRVVARRQLSSITPGDDANGTHYAWYEVLVFVRPRNENWTLIGETRWFRPTNPVDNTKEVMLLSCDVPAGVVFAERRHNNILQVSDATEGHWTQFLPSAETLARSAGMALSGVELRLEAGTFSIGTQAGGVAWLATNDLLSSRKAGNTDQGLFNLLLVTKRVASVSSSEEEAYIGLFHAPSVPQNQRIPLERFGGGDVLDSSRYVGRILTVRTGKPAIVAADIDRWKTNPWEQFFPSTNEAAPVAADGTKVFAAARPQDASLQIIEIYAPIKVQSANVPTPAIA